MANHDRLLEWMKKYVRDSLTKGLTLKKVLASPPWKMYCRDYSRAEGMFELFQTFFPKEKCNMSVAKIFLETCGNHIADWAIQEGHTNSLKLILHHAHLLGLNLWKERCTPRCSPDFHPLNQSIYCGRTDHVNVLLHYGYNLEFTEKFYECLLDDVVCSLVVSYHRSTCIERLKRVPNKKRIFLILLVIRTYIYEQHFQQLSRWFRNWFYLECDAALRMIWRHNPALYLCKNEFLSVFKPFDVDVAKLKMCYIRYSTRVCFLPTSGDYQPFSLAHHSRCKIRQMMGKNLTLPNGVNTLPIPNELKSYLLHD